MEAVRTTDARQPRLTDEEARLHLESWRSIVGDPSRYSDPELARTITDHRALLAAEMEAGDPRGTAYLVQARAEIAEQVLAARQLAALGRPGVTPAEVADATAAPLAVARDWPLRRADGAAP